MLDNKATGLIVRREEAGQKLLAFLARRLEEADAPFFHKWVRTGQVRVNGKRAQPFERLAEGDDVRVPPFAKRMGIEGGGPGQPDEASQPDEAGQPDLLRPEALRGMEKRLRQKGHAQSYTVVFEDAELLVVHKKAGFPSQGGTGYSLSVASEMAALYKGAAFVPAPAHRLDKDTSGLLFAGKTYSSQRALQEAFAGTSAEEDAPLQKEYLAFVHGMWEYPSGVLEDFVEKKMVAGRELVCVVQPHTVPANIANANTASPDAKLARAEFQLICHTRIGGKNARGEGMASQPASLLRVRLLTGRTHQIRVQCASRGFPLWGDGKYGRKDGESLKLHAWRAVWQGREFTCMPDWAGDFALPRGAIA